MEKKIENNEKTQNDVVKKTIVTEGEKKFVPFSERKPFTGQGAKSFGSSGVRTFPSRTGANTSFPQRTGGASTSNFRSARPTNQKPGESITPAVGANGANNFDRFRQRAKFEVSGATFANDSTKFLKSGNVEDIKSRDNSRRNYYETNKEFQFDVIAVNMVSHTRAGGRQSRFQAIVICGNKNGTVGFGLSSGLDTAIAIQKAEKAALNNLITIPMHTDKGSKTIAHDVEGETKGIKILIKKVHKNANRKGIIAGGIISKVFRLAGIENINCKIHGSSSSFHKLLTVLWYCLGQIESMKDIASRLKISESQVVQRFK